MMSQGCTSRYACRGVTLIELMVVLVILIILTTIAVPGMMGLVRDARLSTYTDLLVDTLNLARIEAIRQRKNMIVCTAADPNTAADCLKGSDWSNGVMLIDENANPKVVIRREPFQGGVTVTGPAAAVVFAGTLGSATAAAAFTLCIAGRSEQQVNVLASGRVSKQVNSTSVCD